MKLSEQLEVIMNADRIRIIEGKRGNSDLEHDPNVKILFCGFKGMLQHIGDETEFLTRDPKVRRIVANMEIRHKEFKERGLFPPYEPELTRMYEFKDLTIFLYYDIYIFGKDEAET